MAEFQSFQFDDLLHPPVSFKNVPALAKRLGVKSLEDDPDQPRDLVVMTGGESYSVLALVNAFLDRLEPE